MVVVLMSAARSYLKHLIYWGIWNEGGNTAIVNLSLLENILQHHTNTISTTDTYFVKVRLNLHLQTTTEDGNLGAELRI